MKPHNSNTPNAAKRDETHVLFELWGEFTPSEDIAAVMADVPTSLGKHLTEAGHTARARRSASAVIAVIEDTANLVDCVTPELWERVRQHSAEMPDDGRARVLWVVAVAWRIVCMLDYKSGLSRDDVCALATVLTNLKSFAQAIPAPVRIAAENDLREVESELTKDPGPEMDDDDSDSSCFH